MRLKSFGNGLCTILGVNVPEVPDEVWQWIRRELPDEEFRTWLWAASEEQLRPILGAIYDDVFSADLLGGRVFSRAKDEVISRLPRRCICPLLANKQWLGIWAGTTPDKIDGSFETMRERNPWLTLSRCRACGQFWYVAFDTVDDAWYFERLATERARRIAEEDDWPDTFDAFKNVWPDGAPGKSSDRPTGFIAGVAMELLSSVR